jgi:adenylate cyclase class 2
VGDGPTSVRVLEQLGLRRVFRYQKFRTEYRKASVLIALDETPIGDYLEVEGSRREIVRISHRLGFQQSEFISKSYHELFLAYRRLHRLSSKNMIIGITASK